MDGISFVGKYRDWFSVNKTNIDENTAVPEVINALARISEITSRKSFEISGVDIAKIDEIAEKLTKGKRKAYGSVATVFNEMKPTELTQELKKTCKEEKLLPIAEAAFLRSVLQKLGFNVDVSREMLQEIYPEIKLPKPKGNFGGKKKK